MTRKCLADYRNNNHFKHVEKDKCQDHEIGFVCSLPSARVVM